MDFKEWWDTVGSGIRPAISSDIESHAQFVANAAWNAAQQNTKVAEQTPTNKPSAKCQCGADAVYHYCHICWCMEIDSQKQADTSHVG